MLFVTAGMGGGTGTGAAPEVARIAKAMGILTVGVVTKPFEWEGGRRMANAEQGLAELEQHVDSLIVVLNEQLQSVLGDDITQEEAFAHANDVLKNAVGGIAEIINVPGHVNVDFEDVRSVMEAPGKAMLGTATASGPTRAADAANEAVKCPLLEGIHLSGAKGVLVLVSAAKGSLKLNESKVAMTTIGTYASPDANVIFGTAYDASLGDSIRVTVIATGLPHASGKLRMVQTAQALRTGTDNVQIPTLHETVNPNTARSGSGTSLAPASMRPGYATASHGAGGSTSVGMGAAHASTGGTATSPNVWTMRTNAVDKVQALAASGMEETDIPAFLRKQAD
jgi:cell division protein FtsZ